MIMIILITTLQATVMTNTYPVFARVRTVITSSTGYGSDV